MRFLFKISFPVEAGNKAARMVTAPFQKSSSNKSRRRLISLQKTASAPESS